MLKLHKVFCRFKKTLKSKELNLFFTTNYANKMEKWKKAIHREKRKKWKNLDTCYSKFYELFFSPPKRKKGWGKRVDSKSHGIFPKKKFLISLDFFFFTVVTKLSTHASVYYNFHYNFYWLPIIILVHYKSPLIYSNLYLTW